MIKDTFFDCIDRSLRDGGVNALLLQFRYVNQLANLKSAKFHLVPKFNENQLRQVFEVQGMLNISISALEHFAQTIESIVNQWSIEAGSLLFLRQSVFLLRIEDDTDSRSLVGDQKLDSC